MSKKTVIFVLKELLAELSGHLLPGSSAVSALLAYSKAQKENEKNRPEEVFLQELASKITKILASQYESQQQYKEMEGHIEGVSEQIERVVVSSDETLSLLLSSSEKQTEEIKAHLTQELAVLRSSVMEYLIRIEKKENTPTLQTMRRTKRQHHSLSVIQENIRQELPQETSQSDGDEKRQWENDFRAYAKSVQLLLNRGHRHQIKRILPQKLQNHFFDRWLEENTKKRGV